MKTVYQIVIQWDEEAIGDFDSLIEVENILYERLSVNHEVDGHDMGSGEANIFIITENPKQAFEEIRQALQSETCWSDVRIAYREISGEEYVPLWPKGLRGFSVK